MKPFQDVPDSWGQQMDPNQWNAYYAYGQGYEAYAYGATQDPSLYAYGAYAAQYPQQVKILNSLCMIVPTAKNDFIGPLTDIDFMIFRSKVLKTCQLCLCLRRSFMIPWQCLMLISKLFPLPLPPLLFQSKLSDILKLMYIGFHQNVCLLPHGVFMTELRLFC